MPTPPGKTRRAALKRAAEAREELLRRRARRDPAVFARYLNRWRLAEFHRKWYELLGPSGPDRLVLRAPVERGKSSTLAKTLPLWLLGNDVESSGAIISITATQAESRLATISSLIELAEIEADPTFEPGRLRVVFPDLRRERRPGRPQKWEDSRILVERNAISEHPSILATGIEGPLGGSRLAWIIFDDPESDPRALSEAWRRRVSNWVWQVAESRVLEGGRFVMGGTPGHPEAIMAEAEKLGFVAWSFPAPGLPPEEYAKPNFMVADWPERWPAASLARERRRYPRKQYDQLVHLLAFSETDRFFTRDSLKLMRSLGRAYSMPGQSRREGRPGYVVAGVDLSSGKKGRTSSAITVAHYGDGARRPIHLRSGEWDQIAIFRHVLDVLRGWEPDAFAVESNGIQTLVIDGLRSEAIMRAVGATTEDIERLYVISTETKPGAKVEETEIRSLALAFEAGRWAMPDSPEVEKLLGQIETWTPSGHTGDAFSALWQAEQVWRAVGFREPAPPEELDNAGEGSEDPGDLSGARRW